ncbi:MAG TPA: IS30 family transposase [Candidatus Limnocylindrales bacterium]|nr:IS30 family transposase [Candidatus Limnocylindrales bacterium]
MTRLTREQRREARVLRSAGWSLREIARLIGSNHTTVRRATPELGRRRRAVPAWIPGPGRLTLEQREEISRRLAAGDSVRAIATGLDRAPSTISREVRANGGRVAYRALTAHDAAHARARRPKPFKLVPGPLLDAVEDGLAAWWSPEEISRRLRLEHPDDEGLRVSHETIYRALFVQGRGELRRELARCLRSGRTHRRARGTVDARGTIPGMVRISERPAEVEDRAVPGHWEGDLIIGRAGRSAVGTLVERTSRFVLLVHLPGHHDAPTVSEAIARTITGLPAELVRSLTWDQGKELAAHARFTVDTGVQVYFCDPHSPWQRGTNENTNGLLRQYLPKGTDLSLLSADDLARIAASLNDRPRKTLGFMKPSERFAELVADTG